MSSSDQHERIVAYLDGELSAEESTLVEQQLATDEQFRQELQGVERAWTALDELPMSVVTDDFSRTTMEMLVDVARQDVEAKTIALPIRRRRRRTNFTVLAMASVLFGALIFRVFWQNPNRRLLADLSAIQNVDVYSQFESADFLRQLQRHLGDDWKSALADASELDARAHPLQLVTTQAERKAWLTSISPNDQATLRAKFNRYRELTVQQQAELGLLDQQIATAEDREQLLQTMFDYQQWLNELPPSEQFEYRELDSDSERAKRVSRAMKKAVSAEKFELNDEQLQELFSELRPYISKIAEKNKSEFMKEFSNWSPFEQQNFREKPPPEQIMRKFLLTKRPSPGQYSEFFEHVTKSLPTDVGHAFEELPPREKTARLMGWMRQAHSMLSKSRTHWKRSDKRRGARNITEQELADFFVEDLNPTEKERLLALPRDKMKTRLENLYQGRMLQYDRHQPSEWRGPPPHVPDGSREGRRRGRFNSGARSGPSPHGPRLGPRDNTKRPRRPPVEK